MLVREVLVNGSAVFRSVCTLQFSMSYCKCCFRAPLGAIPNGCSTIRIRFATQSHSDRCYSLHRRNPLRRTLYHLHNQETFPYSSKDNFDRCPMIRSWIILVPLDWLMARHTSSAVHSIAYYRAYVWNIGDGLCPFSLFCRGRALSLNFIPYNSAKNSFFDWSILNTFKIMSRYVLI